MQRPFNPIFLPAMLLDIDFNILHHFSDLDLVQGSKGHCRAKPVGLPPSPLSLSLSLCYVCHLILTCVIFFFTCSLLNFNDMSKHLLVSWPLVLCFFFFFFFFERVFGVGMGWYVLLKKKILFF